jgi:membrane protease YdiL (CAAX protease family)
MAEERGAGNPHATCCGSRRWATASGDPVGEAARPLPIPIRPRTLMDEQSTDVSPVASYDEVKGSAAIATVAIVVLFGAFPLFSRDCVLVVAAAIAALTLVAWAKHWHSALPVGTFCAVCIVFALVGFPSQLWFAIGLVLCALVLRVSSGSSRPSWLRVGVFTREVAWWLAVSIFASATGLLVWLSCLRPDIGDLVERFVPDWPVPVLVLGGLAFSIVNAAVEELAYRGVLMDALEKTAGARLALLGQAAAFGVLHINGFPRGWVGIVLASVFGLLMGIVRRRSFGLLAPWIAHVCIDVVIVILLVDYGRA